MKINQLRKLLPLAALVRKFGFGRAPRVVLLAAGTYMTIQASRRRSPRGH
jgi:hypothetical protein